MSPARHGRRSCTVSCAWSDVFMDTNAAAIAVSPTYSIKGLDGLLSLSVKTRKMLLVIIRVCRCGCWPLYHPHPSAPKSYWYERMYERMYACMHLVFGSRKAQADTGPGFNFGKRGVMSSSSSSAAARRGVIGRRKGRRARPTVDPTASTFVRRQLVQEADVERNTPPFNASMHQPIIALTNQPINALTNQSTNQSINSMITQAPRPHLSTVSWQTSRIA